MRGRESWPSDTCIWSKALPRCIDAFNSTFQPARQRIAALESFPSKRTTSRLLAGLPSSKKTIREAPFTLIGAVG